LLERRFASGYKFSPEGDVLYPRFGVAIPDVRAHRNMRVFAISGEVLRIDP